MDLQLITKGMCDAALKAGVFIKDARITEADVDVKSKNSLVTFVDKQSEKIIVEALKQVLPEAGFIAEEGEYETNDGGLNWIIDPLDGTTNYIHGLPCYSVSIALVNGKDILAGCVAELNNKETFYAYKNGGAFLNGNPINSSKVSQLEDALISTGFPYYDYTYDEAYLKSLHTFMHDTRGIRRFGSAAVDLAYVACGRFSAFFEYSLSPWDVAAGALIVKEAGGIVSDFTGKDEYLFGRQIVASGNGIHAAVLNVIRKYFT